MTFPASKLLHGDWVGGTALRCEMLYDREQIGAYDPYIERRILRYDAGSGAIASPVILIGLHASAYRPCSKIP